MSYSRRKTGAETAAAADGGTLQLQFVKVAQGARQVVYLFLNAKITIRKSFLNNHKSKRFKPSTITTQKYKTTNNTKKYNTNKQYKTATQNIIVTHPLYFIKKFIKKIN